MLVVDWPTPDVPETLARSGFEVVVHGGPGPEDWTAYRAQEGEVTLTRVGRPPDRADLVYSHRPLDELPEIVQMATQVGARAIWVHSGRAEGGAKDPKGCWMPAEDSAMAREIVESAGFVDVEEPYIADVARRLRTDDASS